MSTRSGSATTSTADLNQGRSGQLVGEAFEYLRGQILSGARAAGQRVRDSVLATELGMSRAPVREALRMLEQSGLVMKTPNRSYAVVSFTDHDLYELATLRIALESFAAELAYGNPTTVERLHERLVEMRAAADAGDGPAAFRADRLFHETIVSCAEHSRVARAYAGLRDEIELALRSVDRQRPALDGHADRHERLVDLFTRGPLEELLQELATHIRAGSGLPPAVSYRQSR